MSNRDLWLLGAVVIATLGFFAVLLAFSKPSPKKAPGFCASHGYQVLWVRERAFCVGAGPRSDLGILLVPLYPDGGVIGAYDHD